VIQIALQRCPLLVYLELTGLALALVVTAWVALVAGNPDREITTLQLPEAADIVWEQRVSNLAARITTAFHLDAPTARQYAEWSLDAAARHKLQPELLVSLIYVESTFKKQALSDKGAVGPAQVMPSVWSGFCRGDLHRPADNIDCGAQILAAYLDACGNYACALVHYSGSAVSPDGRGTPAGRRYVARIDAQRVRLQRALL
jgi:soluble lytic murein transglycosylase-like protein